MSHRDRRDIAALSTFALLVAFAGSASAQAGLRPLGAFEARTVDFARQGAIQRLRSPECRGLLEEMRAEDGRTLAARLEAFDVPVERYLAMIPFLDGTNRPLCRGGQSQLLTTRGVPRVLVCQAFLQTVARQRVMAEVYVIHELLHTLGLGENPPSSQEITRIVKQRCASP